MHESGSGDATLTEKRGRRAEDVASWYFRLNGFLTIPGFIVHPDQRRGFRRTEADLIGVRFPFSREQIAGREMEDDELLTGLDPTGTRTVFVLVEVKTDLCDINGPWSTRQDGNMQRVIRRLGFADEVRLDEIADRMYDSARWGDNEQVLQYVCVGARKNDGRQRQFTDLVQVEWNDVATFLWRRFSSFPEKLPDGRRPVHMQWPEFGRKYGEWFSRQRRHCNNDQDGSAASLAAVNRYIEGENCSEKRRL